jgi:hypothetical protein
MLGGMETVRHAVLAFAYVPGWQGAPHVAEFAGADELPDTLDVAGWRFRRPDTAEAGTTTAWRYTLVGAVPSSS